MTVGANARVQITIKRLVKVRGRDGVGIHATAEDRSIGSRASDGCIRMPVRDVIALYRQVPIGTPVLIH